MKNKQMTLAGSGFEKYVKTTRRAQFLAEMERVVPWLELCALVEPVYPKAGDGRPPIDLELMLRVYFLQQWFNLSDPAVEEALYDSTSMRAFAGAARGLRPTGRESLPGYRTLLCHAPRQLTAGRSRRTMIRLGTLIRPGRLPGMTPDDSGPLALSRSDSVSTPRGLIEV
jgi:IS5 family transposase